MYSAKNKHRFCVLLALFMMIGMICPSLTACSGKDKVTDDTTKADPGTPGMPGETMDGETSSDDNMTDGNADEIVLSFPTYLAGENVGAVFFLPQVERFNEKHKGKYRIEIQEIPQASYAEKIKQLAQQKKLPALVHEPGSGGIDTQWFTNVVVKNDMYYDLSGFLDKHPDIKELCLDESLEFCTVDGEVVCMPMIAVRPTGLFYNSHIYKPEKNIRDMTFDEFAVSLGDNKIAFQTVDNGWTTALMLTALLANEEGGAAILQNNAASKLYDYSDPAIVAAVEKLRSLMESHAAPGSIGAAYADAANSFMSGRAAVIANGPWMSAEFKDESSDKWSGEFKGAHVKADFFPGNVALANTKNYGTFWISSQASEKEIEAALAFLAFRNSPEELEAYLIAEGGDAPKLTYSADFTTELRKTPVLADLSDAVSEHTLYVPSILDIMPASVADAEFGKLLPKLADGSLTAEQFCAELTKKAEASRS